MLKNLLAPQRWQALLSLFIARHACRTPYFLRISEEFLAFLQGEEVAALALPPFVPELAHYKSGWNSRWTWRKRRSTPPASTPRACWPTRSRCSARWHGRCPTPGRSTGSVPISSPRRRASLVAEAKAALPGVTIELAPAAGDDAAVIDALAAYCVRAARQG